MQAAGHGHIYFSIAELNVYIMFRDLLFVFTRQTYTAQEKFLVIGSPTTLHLFILSSVHPPNCHTNLIQPSTVYSQ